MQNVVNFSSDTKQFLKQTNETREMEKEANDVKTVRDLPPVFNKRLFASQGTVVLTGEARRIMETNARMPDSGDVPYLNKKELLAMRCVVDGLKLIHKGRDYIKDVLSHVITFEAYSAFEYVLKCEWEDCLSCYYIIHGAVEVTYNMQVTESRNVYQPNIIYSHCSGEYVGLVSAEGRAEDLAPPATVYTKEVCHLLKIDRHRFHNMIKQASTSLITEKKIFLQSGGSILSTISEEAKEKILNNLEKKEFPPNTVLLRQGEVSEHLVLIISGRCQCFKDVFIPEAGEEDMFYLDSRESNDFFGEECVVDDVPSYCTIVTSSILVCFTLHRSALEIVNKEQLANVISANKHNFPSDNELRDRGYNNAVWNKFKHEQIQKSLKEDGKLKYLRHNIHKVKARPPSLCQQHRENMFRFIDKGAQYEPVRAKSAVYRSSHHDPLNSSAQNSMSIRLLTEIMNDDDTSDDTDDDVYTADNGSKLMSCGVAKALDTFSQELESEEDIMKIIEGQGQFGHQLKQAWEVTGKEREENNGFMENSVLVMMKTDDIVRKAKAIADQFATTVNKRDRKKHEEEWNTILHAENKQARMMIAANKYRVGIIRKNLEGIEKKRIQLKQEKYSPGEVNIMEQEKEVPKEQKTFFLKTLEERSLVDQRAGRQLSLHKESEENEQEQDRKTPESQAGGVQCHTPLSFRGTTSRRLPTDPTLQVTPYGVQSTMTRRISTEISSPVLPEYLTNDSIKRVRSKSAVLTRTELDRHKKRQTGFLAARLVMKERQPGRINGTKRPRVFLYMPRSQSSLNYIRQ